MLEMLRKGVVVNSRIAVERAVSRKRRERPSFGSKPKPFLED